MNVAISQLNYTVGDFDTNYKKIKNEIIKYKDKADIIVFSELCLSGYYPFDLLLRDDFKIAQDKVIENLILDSKSMNITIIIGAFTSNTKKGKKLYNSALVISNGNIIFQYNKHLLPVYNIYDEARHFERGQSSPVFELNGKKYGLLICEDIWASYQELYHSAPEDLISNDIKAIFILNGSPSSIDKIKERHFLVSNLSRKFQVPCFYINQVGGNDDIVYDGSSFLSYGNGDLHYTLSSFEEDSKVFNLSNLTLRDDLNKRFRINTTKNIYELIFNQLMIGLRDYVIKSNFSGVVVGSSGGIDSALTIAIAKYALGEKNVTAITMPSHVSSSGSVKDSIQLCKNLGIKLYQREIKEDFKLSCEKFEESFGTLPSSITKENMQARIRGRIIMEYSNHFGVLALSTGNKSEMSVGYATLYGDMNGALNILGDLYKEDVYGLSSYINKHYGQEIIPHNIIIKEPSAELSEDQKDSDSLPPYDILDPILKLYIEGDTLSLDTLKYLENKLKDIPYTEIKRIHILVNKSEFKRKQACPIIRLQNRSFGLGRQVPVINKFI